MEFLTGDETRDKITEYAAGGIPFIFVIDFQKKRGLVMTPEEAAGRGIYFVIGEGINHPLKNLASRPVEFERAPVSFEEYRIAFNKIKDHLQKGNTYLLNLTFPTPVRTNLILEEIFIRSIAPYKLFIQEMFVVFSPELFVRIRDGKISSFPMKGTIDASVPGAEQAILSDRKESFEHNTIVDLIRNDLSMVSTRVRVERFRYIDRIASNQGELLQVSSQVTGTLPERWRARLGDILFTLLPAGSVTGAPKEKTIEIICSTEEYDRGFYTGIFGYFDGSSLDSAVMIRFIENTRNGLIYKSGGGITALSEPRSEYEELIQKVYVPVV